MFSHPSPRRKGRYLCWVQHCRLKIWNVAPSAHKTCHPSNGCRFRDHTNCPNPAIEMPKKGGCMTVPVRNRGAWTPEVVDTAPVQGYYLARSANLPWSKDEVTGERQTSLPTNKHQGIGVYTLKHERLNKKN